MKFTTETTTTAILALFGSTAITAFTPFGGKNTNAKSAKNVATIGPSFTTDDLVGALEPVGFFDPLGFAEKADETTLKRYREAELTHGRVSSKLMSWNVFVILSSSSSSLSFSSVVSIELISFREKIDSFFCRDDIVFGNSHDLYGYPSLSLSLSVSILLSLLVLAVVGFLVGEKVEGSSFLFDAQITGPAITHFEQVPPVFWGLLTTAIGFVEQYRLRIGWVEPNQVPFDQPGLLRNEYVPGDINFDPLNLKPTDPDEFRIMQTKELQNGRLAMLAAAGFMAQEIVDGKGIVEHFTS